jgi:hypothetical protein
VTYGGGYSTGYAPPTVTATTDQIYARLPEKDRLADEGTGWTLLRFLSLAGDQLADVATLIARFGIDTLGETSALTDPAFADTGWLRWLGQLAGLDTERIAAADLRAAIDAIRFDPTSTTAMRRDVAATLTGAKRVSIRRHVAADPWAVIVDTWRAETPDEAAADRAAERHRPAGVDLTRRTLNGFTWGDAAEQYSTWGAFSDAFATYADADSTVPTYTEA